MLVQLNNIRFAEESAKRLSDAFNFVKLHAINIGIHLDASLSSEESKETVALMLGYESYRDLELKTEENSDKVSEIDELMPHGIQHIRLCYQAVKMSEIIGDKYLASCITHIARVSAENTDSPSLYDNTGTKNTLMFDEDAEEWFFIESARSTLFPYDGKYEQWYSNSISNGELIDYANGILKKAPESHGAIWLFLCAIIQDVDKIRSEKNRIKNFHDEAMRWIPLEFDCKEKRKVSWEVLENRDFLRVVGMLAHALYVIGDYRRSYFWFTKLNLMEVPVLDYYAPIIEDLISDSTSGDAVPLEQ
jgi:hypothetical protein